MLTTKPFGKIWVLSLGQYGEFFRQVAKGCQTEIPSHVAQGQTNGSDLSESILGWERFSSQSHIICITMHRYLWLQSLGLPQEVLQMIQDFPFEGLPTQSLSTNTHLSHLGSLTNSENEGQTIEDQLLLNFLLRWVLQDS